MSKVKEYAKNMPRFNSRKEKNRFNLATAQNHGNLFFFLG